MHICQRPRCVIATSIAIFCALGASNVNATSTSVHAMSLTGSTATSPFSEMAVRTRVDFDQSILVAARELWQIDARGNANEVASLSRQAIGHMPHNREAYQMLSAAMRSLEQPSTEYINLAKHGHALFPLDGDITLGLAVALNNTHEPQQAINLINSLLNDSLATAEIVVQAQLIHSWILQSEYCPKIRALVKQNKFDEALALASDFRGRSLDDSALLAADAMRSFIEVTERVQLLETFLQN